MQHFSNNDSMSVSAGNDPVNVTMVYPFSNCGNCFVAFVSSKNRLFGEHPRNDELIGV